MLRLECPGNLRSFQIFTFLFMLPPLNILVVHTQQYQEKRTTVAVAVCSKNRLVSTCTHTHLQALMLTHTAAHRL